MASYETERLIEDLDDIKTRFLNMQAKCEIYEAALSSPDRWAVPDVEGHEGMFQYIPYHLDGLTDIVIELAGYLPNDPDFKHSSQPIRPLSFVEIGCGLARNLNLMRQQELIPIAKGVGFDIMPEYVDRAKMLYGLGNDVFVQDAMTFDYSGFDLLFFYRPFSDDQMQAAFEEYLMDSMKTGAIVIALNIEVISTSRKVMEVGTSGNCFKKL